MKIKRAIPVVFLAVMFIALTCASGWAEMDVGDYSLNGYISLGGGLLSDQPRHMNRGYLKEYLPFPEGFLAETDLSLKSKEGLDYYRFQMSHPGLRDENFLLQIGKIGVYHAQIEYDQLQHLYCTVNPSNNAIGIVLQRVRFNGYYSLTPELDIFAENQFLRRVGQQPATFETGPGNPYNFTTYLRPIDYRQNELKVGAEYDQPNDQKCAFQGRVTYHNSTFENGLADIRVPGSANFSSLPPGNMANYVTAEGAMNLKAYKTRITTSFSYGWLAQNDLVFRSTGAFTGTGGLGASTVAADLSGVTRPWDQLTLRYSYRAYDFENNNLTKGLLAAFAGTQSGAVVGSSSNLLRAEQYSYLRQTVNAGADYRVNSLLACNVGYAWQGVDRTDGQGTTSSSTPQVGLRLFATDWLNLTSNYAFTTRTGNNFLAFVKQTDVAAGTLVPLTYKFYAGSLNRNSANITAEVEPANNVTGSFNFTIYNDNFTNSTFGIQSDRGWSAGADVSWRPHDRVALSLGYDHQQLQVKELTNIIPFFGRSGLIGGDEGPTLTTSDSYDTFSARAEIKLIPKKLNLTTSASYSISHSNFNNSIMPELNEYYVDIRTFLAYQFNEHWACKAGYIFEAFGMPRAYQTLYLQGVNSTTGAVGANQAFNTLDGFYTNATAHVVQAFLQYKF